MIDRAKRRTIAESMGVVLTCGHVLAHLLYRCQSPAILGEGLTPKEQEWLKAYWEEWGELLNKGTRFKTKRKLQA